MPISVSPSIIAECGNNSPVFAAQSLTLRFAQSLYSETLRVIADILEKGKTVKWIYNTHPHLDHFVGANPFKQLFPKARFYSVKGTPSGEGNQTEVIPDYFQTLGENEPLTLN